jgi:hypothetical protein
MTLGYGSAVLVAGWVRANRPDSGSVRTPRATRPYEFGAQAFGVLRAVPVPDATQMSLARNGLASGGEHGEDVLVGRAGHGGV